DDLTALEDFLSRHDVAVVKPLRSSLGQGVKILHDASIQEVLSLMEEYPLGIIVEEMIRQCREMALPHPQSVNTVRLTTYIVDGKVNVLRRPFVRFGTSGNVVDNGAQGGLFSAIDYDTGIVIGVCDEHGRRHVVHPDSGVPLVGFQVPRWGEAIDFVKELAGVLPFCRYIGWDIALTEKGWVMVEGNSHGQFIGFQLPRNKGFRDELLSVDPEALTFKRR
ncbi:MAG: hypothetical protein J5641_03645, partial [Bacteroidales bacterium]|nr:hypothetical protein [Bacteroidales bacterium]